MNGLKHGCRSLNEKSLIENRTKTSGTALSPDVILFSLGRYGSRVAEGLRQKGHTVLGVDFDQSFVVNASREFRYVPTAQPLADEKAECVGCNGPQGVKPERFRYSNTH